MTTDELAALKRLDPAWLREQGVDDLPGGGVSISYRDDDGRELYRRRRDVPGDPRRFVTPAGVQSVAYGRWRLPDSDVHSVMHVAEGESDAWALWAAGLSAVALAGSNLTRRLTLADLGGARVVYVCVQRTLGDPSADRRFCEGVAARLAEVGYQGEAFAVLPPPGVKDVSDMRAADPDAFGELWKRQCGQARRLDLPRLAPPLNGAARPPAPEAFPELVPASKLRAADESLTWVLDGVLRRGEITLFAALWKSGKTTLLAHLVRAMAAGGEFLGLRLRPSRVLYVTEESEARWAARRDQLGLEDHVEFLIRPFPSKPSVPRWEEFLGHVGGLIVPGRFDVVVFDTLANLWPLKDENDAASVQACLMPMHRMIEDRVALHLVHHTRKSDGAEATASRGSGALTGFVDTIIEFRRLAPHDRADRRRVLTGYGRHDETPSELVIELTPEGYVARGDREAVSCRDLSAVASAVLPGPPGLTVDQVLEAWPDGQTRPGRERLAAALKAGAQAGAWVQTGEGRRGSPWLFFLPFGALGGGPQ